MGLRDNNFVLFCFSLKSEIDLFHGKERKKKKEGRKYACMHA
jgi:hypothetical protein